MTDPDDNDAYSGYRPDMDQYPEFTTATVSWWLLPAIFGGVAACVLIAVWFLT
jgi:hypothetical protein